MDVIGYIRVSTEIQMERDSLASQQVELTEFCKKESLNLVEIYKDEGVSAKIPFIKRPAGKKIIQQLSSNRSTGLVITKLDRAFRNSGEAMLQIDQWVKEGTGLYIINFMDGRKLDTTDPIIRLTLGMLSIFAEFERNMISQRITNAKQTKKKQGLVYTGHIFGYDKVDGHLVPNQKQKDTITLIHSLRKEGYSYWKISALLNEGDYPAPKQAGKWYPSTVRKIEHRNPLYI